MKDSTIYSGPMVDWPVVEAIPYAKETLSVLKRDYLISLATNAEASTENDIWEALHRVELAGLFDRIYCYNKIGLRKPTPGFFGYILDDLAMQPEQLLMVGDNFESDILGANAAGIKAVWLNIHNQEEKFGPLHSTVHGFRELEVSIAALWNMQNEEKR